MHFSYSKFYLLSPPPQNSFLKAQCIQKRLTVPERNGGTVGRLYGWSVWTKASLPGIALISTAQYHKKGSSKSPVQKRIEEWVQAWVDVAQPKPSRPNLRWHAVMDEGIHHIGDKKWRPAQAEAAHDYGQRLGCLSFILHASGPMLIVVRVGWGSRAGPVQRADSPCVPHSSDVDLLIGEDHEHQRYVESHGWTHQGVGSVHNEHTRCFVTEMAFFFDLKDFNIEKNGWWSKSSASCHTSQ